jgi:hypothetical protein
MNQHSPAPGNIDPHASTHLTRWIPAIALCTALAPFAIQTVTLVLSGSSLATAVVGLAAALLFSAAAIAFQMRVAGSAAALSAGSRAGIALAVVSYHSIAFPVAHIVEALWFAAPA